MRDRSNGEIFLERLAIGALLVGLAAWAGWKFAQTIGLLLGILVTLPFAVRLLARELIELVHEGFTWLERQPLKEWEGRYYAFDDRQVRIYDEDGSLWFAVDDVVAATGLGRLPARFLATHALDVRRVPGTRVQAVNPVALEQLLAPSRDPRAGRFLLWARREVVAPWKRRNGIA